MKNREKNFGRFNLVLEVLLNIDLKIPMACHVNCVGGIIGKTPVA